MKSIRHPERGANFTQRLCVFALCVLLFLSLLPLGLMAIVSFKNPVQYQSNPVGLTFPLEFGNYANAVRFLAPSFLWTFIVIVVGIGLNLVTSSLAAYAFSRHEFPGKRALLAGITGLMFVPSVLVLFPLYQWSTRLGLRDVTGLAVSYWILGHCFSIFLLNNFFKSISESYFEAAKIDGAGHLYIWWNIVLPLGRTMITTLAIMMLIWIYTNDYVWQYIMCGGSAHSMVSVTVRGMGQSGSGSQDLNHGLEAAGYMVSSVPLLIAFVFSTRTFIRGMTSGGTKE